MLNTKLIFWSLCFACLCLQTTGFSREAFPKKQEKLAQKKNEMQSRQRLHDLPTAKKENNELTYYLYIQDFLNSMIEIPTSNVSGDSSTIASSYIAGRAPIFKKGNKGFGICSASFLCMQNQDGVFSDIANYLVVDNGLIVSWLTPSKLANLELDSILHGMVTECIVTASTKIGANPFFGQQFNMVVSADDQKIFFKLTPLNSTNSLLGR